MALEDDSRVYHNGEERMRTFILICVSLLVSAAAYAKQDLGPWLKIVKSQDGYLFQGHLQRTKFSFDIPGEQIQVFRQQQDGGAANMAIDNLFFSVMPVRNSDFPSTSSNILVSYRKSEQQYEKTHFGHVVLSSLDVCKGAALRHESWELQTLDVKAPAQVYAAFKVGNDVMVISSAFTNAREKKALLGKFTALCKSFEPGSRK